MAVVVEVMPELRELERLGTIFRIHFECEIDPCRWPDKYSTTSVYIKEL
jgi:hypothetical protein